MPDVLFVLRHFCGSRFEGAEAEWFRARFEGCAFKNVGLGEIVEEVEAFVCEGYEQFSLARGL